MSKALFKIIFFFLFIPLLWAQDDFIRIPEGHYYIDNYFPKDYDASPQNWSFTQSKTGLLLVGNVRTILTFDSKKWEQIEVNNSLSIRSLDTDSSGNVYVGTNNDFGTIKYLPNGKPYYKSLVSEAGLGDQEIREVWKTYCTPKGVFFQAETGVFLLKENRLVKSWKPSEAGFQFSFWVNQNLWVRDKAKGLMVINQNLELVKAKGLEEFDNTVVTAILPFAGPDSFLIATKDQGFFIGTYQNLNGKNSASITRFKSPANKIAMEGFIYKGILLKNGLYAFSVYNDGLLIINKNGEIVSHINKDRGLPDNRIWGLYEDFNQNIWLGLDKGISKIEYGLGLTYYNEQDGVLGQVQAVVKAKELLIGTTQGAFKLSNSGKFIRRNDFSDAVWEIIDFKDQFGTIAYARKNGLWVENRMGNLLIPGDYRSFAKFKNEVITACENCVIKILVDDNGKIIFEKKEIPINDIVQKIEVDSKGNIWLGLLDYGLKIITNPFSDNFKIQSYDTTNGLPDVIANKPFLFKEKILVFTVSGIYELSDGRFIKSVLHKQWFNNDSLQVWSAYLDSKNRFWMQINRFFKNSNESKPEIGFVDLNSRTWNTGILPRIPKTLVHSFYEAEEGVIYLASDDGLISYNNPVNSKNIPKPVFNYVLSGKDTVFVGLFNSSEISEFEVDYLAMPLIFKYSLPCFNAGEKTMYSYFIEGVSDHWSDWSFDTKKEFSKLFPGQYVFKIRAKDVFGNESVEHRFPFKVLPPWYLTWWAFFIYLILIIVLVYGIVQLSIYRLKQAKEKLEAIVAERTAEVVKQKDEILVQKRELEKQKIEIEQFNIELEQKNKEITDSIQYAKKIQEAILVETSTIYKKLPQCFILYKPRDIVSGDFYWFREIGDEVLIAAADCTGHGVPGAFMSMIGSTLLNEIVDEKKIYSPEKILEQLNVEVRRSLKQDEETSQSRDGMDIALCKINFNGQLAYAGAMRPLYIIRNTPLGPQFSEVKATKHPIGGKQDEKKEFTLHTFNFNKGDVVYFFSDGYADQFGGPDGKKFMTKKFQQFLLSIFHETMSVQKELLNSNFENWRGSHEQVDDVLIIGVKF